MYLLQKCKHIRLNTSIIERQKLHLGRKLCPFFQDKREKIDNFFAAVCAAKLKKRWLYKYS